MIPDVRAFRHLPGDSGKYLLQVSGRCGGLLGQLKPSKSIGGLRVYGLADRLAVAGVSGRASSRGSLGASLSETWETSLVSDKSSCSSAHDLEAALTFASESIVVLLPYVDFIEDVRFSRSRARVFVFGRKPPLSR